MNLPSDILSLGLALFVGIGLSAACGLRIFVGMLGTGIAAASGLLELSSEFVWLGSTPALFAFAVAAIVEIGAYYVPWLDNFLDTLSTPAAAIAGTMVTASVVTDLTPFLKWTLALIAGGGTAGILQGGISTVRAVSSTITAGMGNSAVSTGEWLGSVVMIVLAVLAPVIALLFAIWLIGIIWRGRRRVATRQKATKTD